MKASSVSPVSFAPKHLSGIDVIDNSWGGLYRGGSYLIYGRAASGRGLLTLMFARTGARLGESTLFISSDRQKDLMIQAASIGFNLRSAYESGIVRLMRVPPLMNLQNMGDDGVAKALWDLITLIRQHRPTRLVMNDFMPFVAFRSFDRFRTEFIQFLEQIDSLDTTMMLVMPEPANQQSRRVIDFMATQMTGSVHIELAEENPSTTKRRITLIPHIGHIKRQVVDYWDLEDLVDPDADELTSAHELADQRMAEQRAAEQRAAEQKASRPESESSATQKSPHRGAPAPQGASSTGRAAGHPEPTRRPSALPPVGTVFREQTPSPEPSGEGPSFPMEEQASQETPFKEESSATPQPTTPTAGMHGGYPGSFPEPSVSPGAGWSVEDPAAEAPDEADTIEASELEDSPYAPPVSHPDIQPATPDYSDEDSDVEFSQESGPQYDAGSDDEHDNGYGKPIPMMPIGQESDYTDRESFRIRLQQQFNSRESTGRPFLLLALRMDRSESQQVRPFDFDFLMDLVRVTLRPADDMLVEPSKERLVVLLSDATPEEAQSFFSRLKERLREESPRQADHLLHSVSAIVVPDGRPFKSAEEFLDYALNEE